MFVPLFQTVVFLQCGYVANIFDSAALYCTGQPMRKTWLVPHLRQSQIWGGKAAVRYEAIVMLKVKATKA